MKTLLHIALHLSLAIALVGCGGNVRAPVENRNAQSINKAAVVAPQRQIESAESTYEELAPGEYIVQPGDTLYSIAWRYGVDVNELAAANYISAPYVIYPGQRIGVSISGFQGTFSSGVSADTGGQGRTGNSTSTPNSRQDSPNPSVTGGTAQAPIFQPTAQPSKPSLPATETAGTATGSSAPVRPPLKAPPVVKPVAKPVEKKPAAKPFNGRWQWPGDGAVIRQFSSSVHKGIDIGGALGEPVNASASGKVVYAGNIVGLGKLLIVKHSDEYLSAYGHNSKLLVPEGADVVVGQKIAEKGSSGTNSVRLHFEIRKNGRPVDPIRLLPKEPR